MVKHVVALLETEEVYKQVQSGIVGVDLERVGLDVVVCDLDEGGIGGPALLGGQRHCGVDADHAAQRD
jgi:hypothetical protein